MSASFHILSLHFKVMAKETLWDKCDKFSFVYRRSGGASLQVGEERTAVVCPKLVRNSLGINELQELH